MKLTKQIKIYQNIKDPWKHFKNADLFVLSSLYEGFPNAIIESILNNTPLISSNCKSGPTEILKQKKGPNLFNIKDHNELAKKIYKHFKSPRILIDKNKTHKKNLNKFDQQKIIKKYDDLFNKL